MQPVIELQNLTKTFGTSRGVSDISLSVPEGSIVGFLGPNGAGKSTTMNMLMGYLRPTSGTIRIFGKDATRYGVDVRRDIGFLTSDTTLDGGLTGNQQLAYYGHMRGNYDKQYVGQLAERLDCDLSRKIQTLSRGNRQKVALIAALMHKPKLLLLDEPTSGLDPLIQAEFNRIILEHKAAGRTAFISSHVLSEIEELCDRMLFIRDGKIIASKTMRELTDASPKRVHIIDAPAKLQKELSKLKGVHSLEHTSTTTEFSYDGSVAALMQLLAKHPFSDITITNSDLETSFMEYYGEEK